MAYRSPPLMKPTKSGSPNNRSKKIITETLLTFSSHAHVTHLSNVSIWLMNWSDNNINKIKYYQLLSPQI